VEYEVVRIRFSSVSPRFISVYLISEKSRIFKCAKMSRGQIRLLCAQETAAYVSKPVGLDKKTLVQKNECFLGSLNLMTRIKRA